MIQKRLEYLYGLRVSQGKIPLVFLMNGIRAFDSRECVTVYSGKLDAMLLFA